MVQSFLVHFTEVSNPGAAEISFYFSYSRNKLIYRFTVAYARKIDLSDKDSILSYQRLSSLFFFFKVLSINWSIRQISKYQK